MSRQILLSCLTMLFVAPALAQTTQPSAGATSQPATTRPAVMPAEQVLNQLLKPSPTAAEPLQPVPNPPVLDQTTGKAVAPAPPPVMLHREGEYIHDRTGRLTRGADGQTMEFTFDADGRGMQDPPMIILPNLQLMKMENALTSVGRDLKFRISGQVTEYKGRNYILLDKVVVPPESAQQF